MTHFIAKITKYCLDLLDSQLPAPQRMVTQRRGVAMLLVLVTITLMSAVVVEFTYQTRIDLALAANQRDKLKSEYLAKSAINIARLLISFQFALQSESEETESSMGQQINTAMRRSNFQMYQYIDLMMGPFNSGKIESPVGGVNLSDAGVEGFGDFVGEMSAKVVPEDGRLNLNEFAKKNISQEQLTSLCSLFLNSNNDALFERKDPYTDEVLDRATMIARIIDYIDLDNVRTVLTPDCKIEGSGGDEERIYRRYQDKDKIDVKPLNARLSHVADIRRVPGVDDKFFQTFKNDFTVYPVGKPNINVANASIFFSILCKNLRQEQAVRQSGFSVCSTSPVLAQQVFWLSMALEGIKTFFENPMTVLLGYVGSSESRLLPSAKKGQPVAFVNTSQLSSFISDLQADPVLMAKFLLYSPTYSQVIAQSPSLAIDPLNPIFPKWEVTFDRSGLLNSVSTDTPKIYRITGTGRYGSTETTIEAVLDFGQTLRRLPSTESIQRNELDPETAKKMTSKREQLEKEMPKGRYLYWHQE